MFGRNALRRRIQLAPQRIKGDDISSGPETEEYMEMPKFQVSHEGWLNVRVGKWNPPKKVYVSLKQGTLTLFNNHEELEALISYNLAGCKLDGYDSGLDRSKDLEDQVKKPQKLITSLTLIRKQKLYTHKTRNFREMARTINGPLWGCLLYTSPSPRD